MNNFIIGTANFGKKYGVLDYPNLKETDVLAIMQNSYENGINLIDTSPAYGNSEIIIGKYNKKFSNKKFKIITKTPVNLCSNNSPKLVLNQYLDNSLKKLNVDHIETILIHNVDDFIHGKKEEVIDVLNQTKRVGKVKKIGVSLYDESQFKEVIKYFVPDVIQLPLSIIDQRALKSGMINEIKKLDCEVHCRSIFLQGLLICAEERVPKKLNRILESIKQVGKLSKKTGYTKLQLALNFVNSIDIIDFKVVGVNSVKHLSQIMNDNRISEKIENIDYSLYSIENEKYVDARNWS